MSTPDGSAGPGLRIVRGKPEPHDIAALVVALLALRAAQTERAGEDAPASTARRPSGPAASWRNGRAVTWRSTPVGAS